MTTALQFAPLQVYSSDEHFGVDRPVAVVLRLDGRLLSKAAQALALIQDGSFVALTVPLDDEQVRWLKTVGYTSENALARVPGPHRGHADWMPADAAITFLEPDLIHLDTDGEAADFREDCVLYESASEPLRGLACLEIMRFAPTQPGVHADAEIHFCVKCETENWRVESFVHQARLLWPDLLDDTPGQRPRERSVA